MHPLTSLPAVTVVVIALCSGCAARTGKSSACEPVPDDFALAGPIVYAECGVDKKARLSTTLPRLDYTPSRDRPCVRSPATATASALLTRRRSPATRG